MKGVNVMEKSNIFGDTEGVKCACCGNNLMENVNLSMVQIITNAQRKITKVYPCCKGSCDKQLLRGLQHGEHDGWQELSQFTNPYLYLKHIMSVMNNMYGGTGFENQQAFDDYKNLLIQCYPYVARNLSPAEIQSAQISDMMPF
jgi:hypothetical protein